MADRFDMSEAHLSMPPCLEPLIYRSAGIACAGQMMCEQFRLALDEIGEILFEDRRDAGVEFLTAAAQQGAVGGVLHQRVLEQIGGMRRGAVAEEEPGLAQPSERGLQFGVAALRYRFDQLIGE